MSNPDPIKFAPTWTDGGEMKIGAVTIPLAAWQYIAQINQATATTSVPKFSSVAVDVTTDITAHAGGGQGDATLLGAGVNIVSTVATAADSVILPEAVAGQIVTVVNKGASALAVFPPVGGKINALSIDASLSVATSATTRFAFTTTLDSVSFA